MLTGRGLASVMAPGSAYALRKFGPVHCESPQQRCLSVLPWGSLPYCGLRESDLRTARYFSRSLLKNFIASETSIGATRRDAFALIRARFSSLALQTFNAPFKRVTTSSAVPGAANNADQILYSNLPTLALSPIVGTVGKSG